MTAPEIHFCKCLNAKAVIEPAEEEDIWYATITNTIVRKSADGYGRDYVCKFCGDRYIVGNDPCMVKIIQRINK